VSVVVLFKYTLWLNYVYIYVAMTLEQVKTFLKQHNASDGIPEIAKIFKRAQTTAELLRFDADKHVFFCVYCISC
jgi:hypothetical protein